MTALAQLVAERETEARVASAKGAAPLELSQWFTPTWLARAAVALAGPVRGHWVEPACGHGALIEAALELPSPPRVEGWDIDESCVEIARSRVLPYALVEREDGLVLLRQRARARWCADLVLTNPPYERGADCDFIEAAMGAAPRVIAIVRSAFLHGSGRYQRIWSRVQSGEWCSHVVVLSRRPSFALAGEGTGSPLSDFVLVSLWRREMGPHSMTMSWMEGGE